MRTRWGMFRMLANQPVVPANGVLLLPEGCSVVGAKPAGTDEGHRSSTSPVVERALANRTNHARGAPWDLLECKRRGMKMRFGVSLVLTLATLAVGAATYA